jgi:hypothetical protein
MASGWRVLRRWAYPSAAAIVVPTPGIERWAVRRFPGVRTAVIPSPAVDDQSCGVEESAVVGQVPAGPGERFRLTQVLDLWEEAFALAGGKSAAIERSQAARRAG